jgi:hypothetical protein
MLADGDVATHFLVRILSALALLFIFYVASNVEHSFMLEDGCVSFFAHAKYSCLLVLL